MKLFQLSPVISNENSSPNPTATLSKPISKTRNKRERTNVKKTAPKEIFREKIQTRATTAKAEKDKKINLITMEGKKKIRRSLFTSSEDVRIPTN